MDFILTRRLDQAPLQSWRAVKRGDSGVVGATLTSSLRSESDWTRTGSPLNGAESGFRHLVAESSSALRTRRFTFKECISALARNMSGFIFPVSTWLMTDGLTLIILPRFSCVRPRPSRARLTKRA